MPDEAYQEYRQKMEQDYMEMVKEQAKVLRDFCKNMAEFRKIGEKSHSKYLLNSADEVKMKLQEKYPDEYISKKPIVVIMEDIQKEKLKIDNEEGKLEEKVKEEVK